MEDIWLMDSGCSRQMIGSNRWFSCLNPVCTKEYITFGDNGKGKGCGVGVVRISDHFTSREAAFVEHLGFNFLSVSQLLADGYEVIFKRGSSRVLDSRGDLICWMLPF